MNQELMDMANKTLELMPPDNHCRELYWSATDEELEAFAALVAATEREACARVCETLGVHPALNVYAGGPDWYKHGKECAAEIRARGETK
jgi:hypothetical protein